MPKKRSPAKTKLDPTLHCLQPNAAGVDVGATQIYVSVPPDRDTRSVRCFATFTGDLHAAADWLQSCRIDTVAMESTGVYWIPFFQLLEARGFKVFLVNARHVKNVPGRKRRRRLSVASVPAYGGFASRVLPARTSRLQRPFHTSPSRQSGADGIGSYPTHAKSSWIR